MNSKNNLKQNSSQVSQQGGSNAGNSKKQNNNKELDFRWIMNNVRCWYKKGTNREEQHIFRKGRVLSESIKQVGNESVVDIALEQENGFNAEQISANVKNLFQREEQNQTSFDDMVKMSVLNEAELIGNLKQRYDQDNIFTYIGPTLIVLNPYKVLKGVFSNETIDKIKENLNKNFETFDLQMQQPHIYAISAMAYKNMIKEKKKQAIVISGESGAGKTENARYSMRFLTQMSTHDDSKESIEEKILSCNPVLEAFGNAKTVRNDNSSRFGKYVQIEVSRKRIIGATITKYLLEKSRVIHLSQGERNYHIFYHLLGSKNQKLLDKISLRDKKPSDFQYLNQSDCYQVESLNDVELFGGIINSFNIMNFEEELQATIFKILSAILYLGNLQFSIEGFKEGESPCSIANNDVLQIVSQLLEIDPLTLNKALVYKTISVKNETCYKPIDIDQCNHMKNTLSKALYDNLFNWLVNKLNEIIQPKHEIYNTNTASANNTIGLLDIFGFENFKENSFEQLCINYTNENLQQLYISYVFKNEELIFKEDGLENYLSNLSYEDNAVIIQNLNKCYKLLNDCCRTQSNDQRYLTNLRSDFKNQETPIIQFPQIDNGTFLINHTQNPVSYKVEGFIAKNIDELSQTIKDVIAKSQNPFVPNIFGSEEGIQEKKGRYLGEKFSNQMVELMKELNSSDVHFVRCVKTNEVKRCDYFLEGYVLQQIEYLGVINSIEVRKSTYPQRRDYEAFFREYKVCDDVLEKKPIEQIKDYKEECKALVKKIDSKYTDKQILFGNSKIYMKMEFESFLESVKYAEIKRKRTAHATRIQLYYRYYKFHIRYQKKIAGVKSLMNKFFAQKIFGIYLQSFQSIQYRARIVTLKEFVQKYTSILKRSHSKAIFETFKQNKETQKQIQAGQQQQIKEKEIELQKQQEIQSQQKQDNNDDSNTLRRQDTNVTDTNQSQLFETIAVNQPSANDTNSVLSSQMKTESSQSSQLGKQNQNIYEVNAFDFQTEDLTRLQIPEKNSNEIYVNPPDADELKFGRDSLVIKLLKQEEIDETTVKNMKQVLSAIDKDYNLSDIEEENLKQIEGMNYIKFFQKKLNERSKFFGKKSTQEILTYKKTSIKGGSLLQLPSKEVSLALTHFEILLLFIQETETIKYSLNQQYQTQSSQHDGQETRIQKLLKYSQNNSQEFKNEVLTQILKQLNGNKNDLYTLRLLHYLVVFCYCFKTEEEYGMAMLNFLIFELMKQWKASNTIKKYIEYVIPTIFRSISYLKEREAIYNKQVLTEMKINSLIFQYQIKVPITLSNGRSFLVDVDPYDNFYHLKIKVMSQLNINTERLVPDMFEFFEVQTKDNQVFERLLFPLEGVWDVIHQQDSFRNQNAFDSKKSSQNQKRTFQFMFKPMFVYTVYQSDEVGISILQSQIYFDTFISNLVIEDRTISIKMLSHLLNITKITEIDIEDPTSILPLSYSEEESQVVFELVKQEYEKNVKGKYNQLQSQFEYVQLAKSNPNLLGLKIQIKYCEEIMVEPVFYLLILNSYQMSFYDAETNNLAFKYKFSEITHWGLQDKFIKLKTSDGKSHIINTDYSLSIHYYISQVTKLMKKQDEIYYNSLKSIYSSINTKTSPIKNANLPQNLQTPENLQQFQRLYMQQSISQNIPAQI